MVRPQLPVGTAGKVRVYPLGTGFQARTIVRDYDGRNRTVTRTGPTKTAAQMELKKALRDRIYAPTRDEVTKEIRITELAELWFASLRNLSPSTLELYRAKLDRQIIPALGHLRLRELSTGTVDRHLQSVAEMRGPSIAKTGRSILSGMCKFAMRQDAIDRNPVRETSPLSTKPKKSPQALTIDQARTLRLALASDSKARHRDLPDLVDLMLATGIRIGEALGLLWTDIDLAKGTAAVHRTVVRVKGQGLVAKSTKTDAGERILDLPQWCLDLLRKRYAKAMITAVDLWNSPVFPDSIGGLRDSSNTQGDLREAMDHAGFTAFTSHSFRKTAATVLDEAGLSARVIADQLGHAKPSLTQDVYMARKRLGSQAAAVLEQLG